MVFCLSSILITKLTSMRKTTLFFALLCFSFIVTGQLPDIVELQMDCPNMSDETIYDGIYIKYEGPLSTDLTNNGFTNECGCYNKFGTNDFFIANDDGFVLNLYHSTGANGGCAASTGPINFVTSLMSVSTSPDPPVPADCTLENFTMLSGIASSCTAFSLTAADPCDIVVCDEGYVCVDGVCELIPPVPTLSQWSVLILGFFLSIFGIVVVRRFALKAA
jgi:hypothetical protein